MPDILIIGYGNSLRGDDAIGVHAALKLERYFRSDPRVQVMTAQQLTPEMTEDISHSGFVLFVDASATEKPGTIRCAPVEPKPKSAGYTHHVSPASLLSAAKQLYGARVQAMCLTLSGWSFELDNKLSPGARLRLPELVREAREIIGTVTLHK